MQAVEFPARGARMHFLQFELACLLFWLLFIEISSRSGYITRIVVKADITNVLQ
jgi:hypothetical protein